MSTFADVFMVHIRAVGGWTEKVYELFHKRNVVEEPHKATFPMQLPKREQKLSMRGILNFGFEQDDELWKVKGPRYAENLKEFNRKVRQSWKVVSDHYPNFSTVVVLRNQPN